VERISLRTWCYFNDPRRSHIQPTNTGWSFAVVAASLGKMGFRGMPPQEFACQEGCAQKEGHGREEDGGSEDGGHEARGQESRSGQACCGEARGQQVTRQEGQ